MIFGCHKIHTIIRHQRGVLARRNFASADEDIAVLAGTCCDQAYVATGLYRRAMRGATGLGGAAFTL
ncbi:hypothetical protein D9M69_216800 [compost metagenome]